MEEKRLFVRGLDASTNETELARRFESFGKTSNPEIIRDSNGTCRGFGYLTISTTSSQFSKCLSVYNKTKWKGKQIVVEEAKIHWRKRLEEEWNEPEKVVKRKKKKLDKRVVHASSDMKPLLDSQEPPAGWKKGKFGRLVSVVNVRDPKTKKLRLIDPSKLQHCLKKLRCDDLDIPSDNLTWFIEGKPEIVRPLPMPEPKPVPKEETAPEDVDVQVEKKQSLDIFKQMFGDVGPEETEQQVDQGKEDKEESNELIEEKSDYVSNQNMADDEIEEQVPEEEEENNNSDRMEKQDMEIDLKEPEFQVNTNLRSLIFDSTPAVTSLSFYKQTQEGPSMLFSKQPPAEEIVAEPSQPIEATKETTTSFISAFSTQKFFFLHANDNDPRSLYSPDFSFKRSNTM